MAAILWRGILTRNETAPPGLNGDAIMSYLGLDVKIVTLLDTRLGGHRTPQLAGLGRVERTTLFEMLEDEMGMAMDPWARGELVAKKDLSADDIIAAFEDGIILW